MSEPRVHAPLITSTDGPYDGTPFGGCRPGGSERGTLRRTVYNDGHPVGTVIHVERNVYPDPRPLRHRIGRLTRHGWRPEDASPTAPLMTIDEAVIAVVESRESSI